MTTDTIPDQTPGRFPWLGLPPSYAASMRFPGTREQLAQACLEAVRKSRFRVRRSDLTGGWVQARARVSFRSYSEDIRVYVDDENRVHVTSECAWPLTVIDWGKNRWNVRRILANLTLILGAPY